MVESTVRIDTGIPIRVKREFEEKRSYYSGIGYSTEKVNEHAINQVLNPLALDRAGVKLSDLNPEASDQIAGQLIEAAPSRMGELIDLFKKAPYSDSISAL